MTYYPRICLLLIAIIKFPPLGQTLDWEEKDGYRLAKLKVKASGGTGFKLLKPEECGIHFANRLSRQLVARNRNLANGSGVAVGDINGDGLPDIYFCGLQTDNKLYLNKGNLLFEDITISANVACSRQYSTGALLEDVDGDGDNDLIVTALAKGARLYLNNGSGRFTEKINSGLFPGLGATSMAMADYDLDGDLDLYVTNYRTTNYKDRPPGVKVNVERLGNEIQVTPSTRFTYIKSKRKGGVNIVELGEPDFLYENLGGGKFKPVSWVSGKFLFASGKPLTAPPRDWGLSVAMRDFNGDNFPDIYVCNDYLYSVDKFWINQGDGAFKLADFRTIRNFSMSSMSIDCADIDLDGYQDFFVADMLSRKMQRRHTQRGNALNPDFGFPVSDKSFQPEFSRNTLQLNRGDGTFAEIAQLSRIDATEWTWASRFMDVDLDGFQDLILTTGNEADVIDGDMMNVVMSSPDNRESHMQNMMKFPKLTTSNLIFRNNDGLVFTDKSKDYGFHGTGISHGMATGDFDLDGDLDLAINNLNQKAFIFENISSASRIAFKLSGERGNSNAIGAKVSIATDVGMQSQSVTSGGRYLSSDEPVLTFGDILRGKKYNVKIVWPSGHVSEIHAIPPNSIAHVKQSDTTNKPPLKPLDDKDALFAEWKTSKGITHSENNYDDSLRNPLLTNYKSTPGPGLTAVDLDGDMLDELLLGTSKGDVLRAVSFPKGRLSDPITFNVGGGVRSIRDTTTVIALTDLKTPFRLIATHTNYEDGLLVGHTVSLLSKSTATSFNVLEPFGAGVVAVSDIDSDGDLDFFVGGGPDPQNPFSKSSSYLFINSDQGYILSSRSSVLKNIGNVTGAVFTDLDNDQDPDLVLSRKWNSPMIFINSNGEFIDQSESWGIGAYHGLWNGVNTGDFNNDGYMDIVLTNYGRNSKYNAFIEKDILLYVEDFNGDGFVEGVETVYDSFLDKRVPMHDKDSLVKIMPWVADLFPTYKSYSQADIQSILEPASTRPEVLKLNILDTVLLLNNGESLTLKSLPLKCQISSSQGCSVADFNGDGNEDIYLSQNFFDVHREVSRIDAGLGQILLGDGNGGFEVLNKKQSGVAIYGQARGCVASDLNGDGRVDIATAQNNDSLVIHLNQTGDTGVRVLLQGKGQNSMAIGASLILESGAERGPKRELKVGSGYLSQDSIIQIFALKDKQSKLHVTWPNSSRSQSYNIPTDAKTIVISQMQGARVVD